MENSWLESVLHDRPDRIFVEMHAQRPDDPHIGGATVSVYDQLNEADSLVVSLEGFCRIICLDAVDKLWGNHPGMTRYLVDRRCGVCGRHGRVCA